MANVCDEREITIMRELAYDIIKRVCHDSNDFDSTVFKKLSALGYYYEDNKGFDEALRNISPIDLEEILLCI